MFSFTRKTTASILSSFVSTLAELDAHANASIAIRDERLAAADVARKEAAEHDAEATAAANVASKLRALIG